jgi:hypothetical protein
MTGTQWLLGWIFTLFALLVAWGLYLSATYGFDKEDQ